MIAVPWVLEDPTSTRSLKPLAPTSEPHRIPMFSPPTSTEGSILGAVGVLAAGATAGALVGSAASPAAPTGNKTVGAIEGGTIGVLATALGGLLIGEFQPKYKKLGEMTGLVGLGAVVVMAAVGAIKNAAAATTPTPSPAIAPNTMRVVTPSGTAPNGTGRLFSVTTADSGSAVPMAVGDQLAVNLPTGTGANWFTFTSTGGPASSYQGLTFANRSTQSVSGGTVTQYAYNATQSLGGQVVQMVFQLLATDANGAAIFGSQPTATFSLWVGVQ
jgi:hypothetical protein